MEDYFENIVDITYMSELTLDIRDVKGLIRPASCILQECGGAH